MNGILVGAIQLSPNDPYPAPVISVDYVSEDEAREAAKILESLQNGVCPLKVGESNPVYMGDTKISVNFVRTQGGDVLCEVYAKRDPRHLTCGFYGASKVSSDQVKAFRELLELQRSYTFTVSCNGRVMTRSLDVVKYDVTESGVRS